MDRINNISKATVPLLLLTLLFITPTIAQSSWEGIFMEQFQVKINFDGSGGGNIEMFDGSTRIQNDGLIKVIINERQITFNIPAKQTDFRGELHMSQRTISGNFIFPDGSLHPVRLEKVFTNQLITNELTKTAAVEDLLQLYTAIKQDHPYPFEYITHAEFDSLYSSTASLDEEILTSPEFYLRASILSESIKCSHTGLKLPNNLLQNLNYEFPLPVFIDNEEIFVLENDFDSLQAGSRIIKINQLSTDRIIENLKVLVPVNGNNLTTKANVINRNFGTMLPLIDPGAEYHIELENNGKVSQIIINAVPRSVLVSDLSNNIQFEIESNQVAYLKISSFGIRDMDEYFAKLEDSFKQLQDQKVPNLVLDLRDNSGGHPIFAAQLLSYLTAQEFTYFRKNLDVPDFEPLYNPMPPNIDHYIGSVYVFVNGGCLSTSGHLISLLKQHTTATFIGEDPGSTYRCNDFSQKIVLQNSKIELNLPRTSFETMVEGAAKEIPFPIDYKVQSTLSDALSGTDIYKASIDKILSNRKVN